MGAVYEKILGQKIEVKIPSRKMGEMVAVSEKILGGKLVRKIERWKINVKNYQ